MFFIRGLSPGVGQSDNSIQTLAILTAVTGRAGVACGVGKLGGGVFGVRCKQGGVEYAKVSFLTFKMFHAEVFRKEVSFLVVATTTFDLDHGNQSIGLVFTCEEVLGEHVCHHRAAGVKGFGRLASTFVVSCNRNRGIDAGVFRIEEIHQPRRNSADVDTTLTSVAYSYDFGSIGGIGQGARLGV